MKKLFLMLFLFILVISFGACKEPIEENTNNEEQTPEEQEQEPVLGSLYINYHFYNGVEDILQKIDSIDEFEFIEPKREGYVFEGWFKDEDCMVELTKADLKMPVDTNSVIVEAYSEWTIERYKVKFFSDGELILERIVQYGSSMVRRSVHAVLVGLDHLLDHLTAHGTGLTAGQVAVIALLQVHTDLRGGLHLELIHSLTGSRVHKMIAGIGGHRFASPFIELGFDPCLSFAEQADIFRQNQE